jgi:hypothetical protein
LLARKFFEGGFDHILGVFVLEQVLPYFLLGTDAVAQKEQGLLQRPFARVFGLQAGDLLIAECRRL